MIHKLGSRARTLILIAVLATLLVPLIALAQAAPTAVVMTPRLNVRSGPSPNFNVLAVLDQGNVVTLLGRNADSSWAFVRTAGNVEGWASTRYLTPTAPFSGLPVVSGPTTATATPGGPAGTPQPTGFPPGSLPGGGSSGIVPGQAVVSSSRLNLRAGPGAGYAVAAVLNEGDLLTLLGRNSNGSWAKVRTAASLEGWVSTRYITIAGTASDLPVLANVEPAATVTTGTANVRSGPGANFNVITTADYGTVVNLLGRNGNASWVQIRINGQVGWVDASYLSTNYNIWFLPVPTGI
jgi:uncharacterized protein YraI